MISKGEAEPHNNGYSHRMTVFTIPQPSVAVAGCGERFPVRRIFCIGKNYAAHAREMGGDPEREPPVYFSKAADAIVESGSIVDYPPQTTNLHHEIELVVAIGVAGEDISPKSAIEHIFGYAVGIDLTRRDLQAKAKKSGLPWDAAKNFDQSAPIASIHRVTSVGHPEKGRIWLGVDGDIRQNSDLKEMIWSVPECIAEISSYCVLAPGDLIFTGTPAGVGPLSPGNKVTGGIDGLGDIDIEIGRP